MPLQINLTEAIRLLIAERGSAPLDLYEVVALLQVQFSDMSPLDLAKLVAEEGVVDGAKFLSWEPPES